MKRMASAGETSKSSGSSINSPDRVPPEDWSEANFALCVDTGSNVDLDLRKLYRVRSDKASLRQGLVRIIDESGEDYLYPTSFFLPVRLSERAARVFRRLP
jgi:hypothetical protein